MSNLSVTYSRYRAQRYFSRIRNQIGNTIFEHNGHCGRALRGYGYTISGAVFCRKTDSVCTIGNFCPTVICAIPLEGITAGRHTSQITCLEGFPTGIINWLQMTELALPANVKLEASAVPLVTDISSDDEPE